jgi:hypothetical protein
MNRILRTSIGIGALATLACPPAALAHHYNRAGFVRAFERCDAAVANAMTSGGVVACKPAVPFSSCTEDAATALVLRQPAKARLTYFSTGRRETRTNAGEVDIFSRIDISGIENCDGTRFEGDLDVEYVSRVFREDASCGASGCVLPDVTVRLRLPCERGRCRATLAANDGLTAAGLPAVPSDQIHTVRFLRIAILDRAGHMFLTTGLNGSGAMSAASVVAAGTRAWLSRLADLLFRVREAFSYGGTPRRGTQQLARYVQAYLPCEAGTEQLVTEDGWPACTPVPVSDCAVDPDHAIVGLTPIQEITDDGSAKLKLSLKGTTLRIHGHMFGLFSCNGEAYTGALQLRAVVRATLEDPACGDDPCTTTDTPLFSTSIAVNAGHAYVDTSAQLSALGAFPGSARSLSAEVLEMQLLDESGRVALVAPSSQVRCNPGPSPEETGFCYGN